MANGIYTPYFLDIIINHVFQTRTYPPLPKIYYIALLTSAPVIGENQDTFQEPAPDYGYARAALNNLNNLTGENGAYISNRSFIQFPESVESWGVMTHFAVFDTEKVGRGRILIYGELSGGKEISAGMICVIRPETLKFSIGCGQIEQTGVAKIENNILFLADGSAAVSDSRLDITLPQAAVRDHILYL